MIINIVLLVFVLAMTYIWSMQGLFSALLHLILTILAGLLALAVWEPLVLGLLIDRMPEYAWGVGLIVPFLLILLALRIAFDRLVAGNVQCVQIVNVIGGGALGLISGVLSGGLIVIALLFIGPMPLGYQPLETQEDGTAERSQSLWIPADRIAGSFFTLLSDNALSPWSGNSIGAYRGSLHDSAARFALASRPGARHAIQPDQLKAEWAQVPPKDSPLPNDRQPGANQKVLIVSMTVTQGAFDPDGVFTVFPAQVALGYRPNGGRDDIVRDHPVWYIQRNAFGDYKTKPYVSSKAGVMEETIRWAFAVHVDAVPEYLSVKGTRVQLSSEPVDYVPYLQGLANETPDAGIAAEQAAPAPVAPPDQGPVTAEGMSAKVTDGLDGIINANDLSMAGGSTTTNPRGQTVINNFDGVVRYAGKSNLADNLQIRGLAHSAETAIVQVRMKINKFQHTLPKIMAEAASLNPPQLLDTEGDVYSPIGFSVTQGAELRMRYRPTQPILRLAEIDLSPYSDQTELVLYFRVPRGVTIMQYRLGNAGAQALNLAVPK